jgi:hypothetical protein
MSRPGIGRQAIDSPSLLILQGLIYVRPSDCTLSRHYSIFVQGHSIERSVLPEVVAYRGKRSFPYGLIRYFERIYQHKRASNRAIDAQKVSEIKRAL